MLPLARLLLAAAAVVALLAVACSSPSPRYSDAPHSPPPSSDGIPAGKVPTFVPGPAGSVGYSSQGYDPNRSRDGGEALRAADTAAVETGQQALTDLDNPSELEPVVVEMTRNTWMNAAEDHLSTFAIDVDTASYTQFRAACESGTHMPATQVRLEEWVNYFETDDAVPASREQPLQVSMQSAPTPWDDETHLVRVALTSYVQPDDERPPMNIVVLLDRSGSMSGHGKLALAVWGIRRLLDTMRPQDRISIVSYSDEAKLEIGPTGPRDRSSLEDKLDGMYAEGSTNGAGGLQLAYDTAERARQDMPDGTLSRVLMCSDGDFNVGLTGDDLVNRVQSERDRGIYLSALLYGYRGNDPFLEAVTNHGNGTYHFIDSRFEAERVLKTNIASTVGIIGQDVKLQIDFDSTAVNEYRLLGYDNRMIHDHQFRDDTVDAGEIGPGHRVIAYYEVRLNEGTSLDGHVDTPEGRGDVAMRSTVVIARLRYKQPNSTSADRAVERAFPFHVRDMHASFAEATADFRFGAAVTWAGLGMRDAWNDEGANAFQLNIPAILAIARAATADKEDRHQFVALIDGLRLGS